MAELATYPRVIHLCGSTLLILRRDMPEGELAIITQEDILWPAGHRDGDPLYCVLCRDTVLQDEIICVRGVQPPTT